MPFDLKQFKYYLQKEDPLLYNGVHNYLVRENKTYLKKYIS